MSDNSQIQIKTLTKIKAMDIKLVPSEFNESGFIGKRDSGNMCPICGEMENTIFHCTANKYLINTCKYCGSEYVFPSPSSAEIKINNERKDCFKGGEEGGCEAYDAQSAWSTELVISALDTFGDKKGLSILNVGCGYGTHLAIAAERGWKCFGVELSDHARGIAQSRLGGEAYIVESISDLIPHEFDLVLLLDVIEHLPSPYSLFYSLFSIGAITAKTRIVITTPSAGSSEACRDPAGWAYRHPPSHLVYYTEKSLSFLLKRLQFTDLQVKGLHPIDGSAQVGALDTFAGLLAYASGSNFTEFMRERYVPGTWSKIAEYEHMPRYSLARTLAADKQVLDFGCGTGYGAALLSRVATSVTGLDIDANAHNWACDCHRDPRLHFHLCDDLGASLPSKSFDLVTCFEMIEHVDHVTQQATIASIARLLRDDGVLLISTPNPKVTAQYGENIYHLREMTEQEFLELLSEHFHHVTIMKQRVRISIAFDGPFDDAVPHLESTSSDDGNDDVLPLAFVAICSNSKEQAIHPFISFDDKTDFISEYMVREAKLNKSRFDAYRFAEQVSFLEQTQGKELVAYRAQSEEYSRQVSSLQAEMGTAQAHIKNQAVELAAMKNSINGHSNKLFRIFTKLIHIGRK